MFGVTGDGAHARYMKVPARTNVPLPDELTFEEGAAVSCGTGTAYGALKRLDVSGRDTLAVFGQGPVGLSATMLGVAMGARVIAVDIARRAAGAGQGVRRRRGRQLARDRSGEGDPELTHGEGAEATMDCTGLPEPRVAAVRSAATWGRMCFVGEGGATTFDISRDLIRKQLTLVASWTFSSMGQWECARFVADRKIPLGADPHPPFQPRSGRRGLPALRHADHRQGRLHELLALIGQETTSCPTSRSSASPEASARRPSTAPRSSRRSRSCPPARSLDIFELEGIPVYNQDLDKQPPARVVELKARVRAADAILFATPEYNYSMPGVLKNAIDWASRPYGDSAWQGKPVAVMGASVRHARAARGPSTTCASASCSSTCTRSTSPRC